ncbi:MAG: DUF1430 domain-containing protein [Defluviitaleaceae bacterium]|nr:DUF1430 domain-containing protein [Defluviitaleaceae bacterium]
MKKFIVFLVSIQMIIISMYGLLLVRGYSISSLVNQNTASLMLVFDTFDEYLFFLSLAEREEVTITRPIFIDDTSLIIYTSDSSLDGRIELRSGRFPYINSNEFVSSINTNELNQVGIIRNITPGFTLSISRIENITNVDLHGIYFINSTDLDFVQNFVYELNNNIYLAELFSISNEVTIFSQITMIQIIELAVMSLLLFICILAAFINYSVGKLKLGSVFIIHGYSKLSIIKKIAFELLVLLIFAFGSSYFLLLLYMSFSGYSSFIGMVSLYFVLVYSFLFLVYMAASNLFISIYLFLIKTTNILKGKKPYFILQFANHISKIAFVIAILIFGSLAVTSFSELNQRTSTLSNWELANNIYATRVYSVGQASNLAIDLEIITRKLKFYESMAIYNNAFIMDSRNIFFLDEGLMPYYDMSSAPPLELSPHGYRITISPNFLELNPIVASNELPIFDQIIYDTYVLNILVPERLAVYEDELLNLYLNYFYFSSIGIDNIYNSDLGLELNNTPIENLSVNIIYVENYQYYFSFDYRIRPQYGNRIKDPVAVLYTGSLHPSRLSSSMGGNFFFHTEAIDAHNSILPILLENDLSHVIRSVFSVFDQNGRAVVELREQSIRVASLIFILIISSVAIIYSLMSNYFEKNRQRIFIKSIMGLSFLRRHLQFLLIVSFYSISVVTIISFFLGYEVFILGIILLAFDILFMFLIDKKLTRESFSKIIKGEA